MSGYIHTIGFKVLIDSEVVDFTFRVPRGTLLVQILDELETTLRIHPKIIATINHLGEIVKIENQYATIDYLIQKYGTEFYAGETSIVTFNHGNFIVDLEVPEAIPFAATFRTACKSFSVKTLDVGIARQNGQVMDSEVFSMPTAFVLNSWGNFYRIAKDEGDTIHEFEERLIDRRQSLREPVEDKPIEEMVYPPKLDGSDLIEAADRLIEATQFDEEQPSSELDSLTDHFVESSFPEVESETSFDEDKDIEPFLTKPEEEPKPVIKQDVYSWSKPKGEELGSDDDLDKMDTLESILDEIDIIEDVEYEDRVHDVQSVERALAPESTQQESGLQEEPSHSELTIEKSVVEDVFKGILADEAEEREFRASPLDDVEEDEIKEFDEEVTSDIETSEAYERDFESEFGIDEIEEEEIDEYAEEDEELELSDESDIWLPDMDDESEGETYEEITSDESSEFDIDVPIVQDEEESIGEEAISDLPDISIQEVVAIDEVEADEQPEPIIDESSEYVEPASEEMIDSIPYIPEEEFIEPQPVDETIIFEEPHIEKPQRDIEDLTSEVVLTDEAPLIEEEQTIVKEAEPITPSDHITLTETDDSLSMEERLAIRKKELQSLEASIKAEEKPPVKQRSISIDYYKKMFPQKVFPLTVKIPPVNDNNNSNNNANKINDLKIIPVFPGCYITPRDEIVDMNDKKNNVVEFTVTPLIRKGVVNGRVGLWDCKRNILTINTKSRIANPFWPRFTGVLGVLLGIIPLILELFIGINDKLATAINTRFSSAIDGSIILWIEIALFGFFLITTVAIMFANRPLKESLSRKFYNMKVEVE
ncbi:MAG: hypothetical protein FK734_07015 [Asgard group archaeon]|nr:hypothetical protein [Asgard group archaeon]